MTTTATRRPALRTFTKLGETFTVVQLTAADLAGLAETVADLGLPADLTGLQPLKGWNVFDAQGEHIGRVFARSTVMTAEWYDAHAQLDWLMAEWGCRRLERAVYQIALLRRETLRGLRITAAQRETESYLALLESRGLGLDEDGDEVPLCHAHPRGRELLLAMSHRQATGKRPASLR